MKSTPLRSEVRGPAAVAHRAMRQMAEMYLIYEWECLCEWRIKDLPANDGDGLGDAEADTAGHVEEEEGVGDEGDG